MHFMDVLVWAAALGGFCLATVCLAGSLYYLAEIVEEHTVMTRKVIRFTTITVVVILALLWILDGYPMLHIWFSMACHGFYSLLLKEFPFIELTSPVFIMSCVLVLTDHFWWFYYFTTEYYRFAEVVTFFSICVWLVPFMFFISLSASENTLPSVDANAAASQRKGRIGNRVLTFLNVLLQKRDELLPSTASHPVKAF